MLVTSDESNRNEAHKQKTLSQHLFFCTSRISSFSVDETWLRRELPVARSRVSTLNRVLARREKEMIETLEFVDQQRICVLGTCSGGG